jgi:DHA1 family multidrug resistance protein-like MFS transporter
VFFAAFPLVYLSEEQGGLGIYNFSFVAEGTAFVSIIVAGVLGFAIYVCYQHFYMRPWIAKNGWPVNEKRLELAIPASFFASVGLWIFAWSARKSAHWIGPLIGTGLFAASNFVTLQCLFFYIILSYQEYGASILAANDVLRAAAATGMLHAGSPFYKALGIDGGTSLLAGLALLGVGGMWVLYHYGARLRAKSRFAVGDGN